jgi:hypothetical protein
MDSIPLLQDSVLILAVFMDDLFMDQDFLVATEMHKVVSIFFVEQLHPLTLDQ